MRWLFFISLTACVMHVNLHHKIEVNIVNEELEQTYSYKKDVLPIIQNRCAMCHNAGVPERNWLDYKTAYNKRASIKLRLENRTMPLGINMLENERQLMIDWVKQGAKP